MKSGIILNSPKAWILAARPKTLSSATAPVLVGCALAHAAGLFQWIPALLCLLFAWLMQIDANLINDLYDYLKGSDTKERLGPERACAQGWITVKAMRYGIGLVTLLACMAGFPLLFYGGAKLIAIGAVCIVFAFLYTASPYPLAYHGWGDILVVLFFGLIPTGCTYYIMGHHCPLHVMLAALSCGLVVNNLLIVNNYRDREQDALNGKRTIIVLFGAQAGSILYLLSGITATLLCLCFTQQGMYTAAFLPFLYLPLHILTWRKMVKIKSGKALNSILGETSRNNLLFALLLAAGIIL